MKALSALLVSVLLTACGGGDVADESAPEAQAARASPVRVMLYGDSTQVGVNTGGVNGATVAQQRLDRTGYNVQVSQEGVAGSTVQQLLTGTDGRHPLPFAQTVAAVDAQIVGFRYGNPDHKYYSARHFHDYLETLTSQAEAAGKVVILQTPSPLTVQGTERDRIVQQNVRAIREVAAAHPNAVLCDHRKVAARLGFENSDGVHPTAEDYRLRQGPTLAGCIKAAMAKLP